ncbi:hypothetical protein CCYA_CCYA05G1659 [Cyanidiococcus yangmingshanensis]|nr:hypothetical protein CCYA_CCYA05G1659 [Cyanidiococcus yangmingshanensis]
MIECNGAAFLVCSGLGPHHQPSSSSSSLDGGDTQQKRLQWKNGAAEETNPSVDASVEAKGVSQGPKTRKQPLGGFAPTISLQELTGRTGRLLRSQRSQGDGEVRTAAGGAGAGTVPSVSAAAAWLAKRRAAWHEPVAVSSVVEDVLPKPATLNTLQESVYPKVDRKMQASAGEQATTGAAAAAYRETLDDNVIAKDASFREVVVIFGKRLVRDQITYEYAVRILTLVRHMATGRIQPSAVCFTGGRDHEDSLVSEAVAGYLFFRHVCEEVGLDLSQVTIILEEQHLNARDCMSSILNQLGEHLVGSHFTFVSSDYHLIRIREVEASVPKLSLLAPLRKLRGTVSYAYATYPFALSKDAAVSLAGRAIVAAAELGITIVALRSYIEGRDLFHRDTFRRFQEATMELGNLSEKCNATLQVQVAGSLPPTDGALFTQDMRQVAEVIESAYFELRQMIRSLEPWIQEKRTLSRLQLQEMLQKIIDIEQRIRRTIDPDRPLTAMEWYRLPTAFLAPVLGAVDANERLPNDDEMPPWPASTSTSMSAAESVTFPAPSRMSLLERPHAIPPNASSSSSSLHALSHQQPKQLVTRLDSAAARLRQFASMVSEASQAIFHEVLRPDFHEERARRISEENRRRKRAAAIPETDLPSPSVGARQDAISGAGTAGTPTKHAARPQSASAQTTARRHQSISLTSSSPADLATTPDGPPNDSAAAGEQPTR